MLVILVNGGAGGNGSITTNILGSILHYPEEKIIVKTKVNYKLDEKKFYYEKQNDIQTEDLKVGKLVYEIENPEIISIDKDKQIIGIKEGKTKVKVTDVDNYNYSMYIEITVIDEESVYINDQKIQENKGKEGYKDGTYYYATMEDTVKIKVTAGNEFSEISLNGNTSLYELEQTITLDKESKITEVPVTITSPAGAKNETIIYIERISKNYELGQVKINEEEIDLAEKKFIKYIDEDSEEETKIEINTEDEYAKIVITDKDGNPILDENGTPEEYKQKLEKELLVDEEDTKVYFKIVAENGEESEVYEVIIEKVSTNATLKEIYVNDKLIDKNEEGEYIAYVLDTDEIAKVKAIANSKKADVKIAQGEEKIHIAEENIDISNHEELETPIEIPILVTPKLGEAQVSYLYIYKMSTSLELSNITLDGIKPNKYNEQTSTYTFLVDDTKTEFDLSAIAESKYTTLKYRETENEGSIQSTLKVEQTEEGRCFKIIAESKAGTTREYKIDIIRKPSKDPSVDPSEDPSQAPVQYLKVNDKVIQKDPEGNYEIKLGDNIENIEVISSIISQTEEEIGTQIDINDTGKFETPTKQVILEKEEFEGKEEVKISIKVLEEDETITENTLTIKFQKGAYIAGRILTENAQGKYIADVTVYRLSKNTNKQSGTNEENEITVGNYAKEEIAKVKTNQDGTFKILVYMPGGIDDELDETNQALGDKYEIVVTKLGYLDYTVRGIKVEKEKVTTLEPYKLIAGDIMKTGEVELDDLVNLNDRYGLATKHPECDLNEDGKVDKIDREILKKNYTRRAEILNLDIKNKQDRLIKTGDFILPLIGKYTITSNYGMRVHPITGEEKLHAGMDISGVHHTEILAVADGEITFCGSQNGYGNCIEIKHIVNGQTIYSFYTHLSKIDEQIKVGNRVEQGQIIGLEGGDPDTDPNPGTSTGHHLHFELRTINKNGSKNVMNPKDYIQF